MSGGYRKIYVQIQLTYDLKSFTLFPNVSDILYIFRTLQNTGQKMNHKEKILILV